MFKELLEGVDLRRLKGRSSEDVKNAFFANYLGALILLRLQDLPGLKLINDATHANLSSFSSNMSDLNFWGRALFKSDDKKVSTQLLRGHAGLLADESGRISKDRINKTVRTPLQPPEGVDWSDTTSALALFKHRFGINSSHFNNVSYALSRWDSLSVPARQRAVNLSFMYLLQSDPKSALTPRLRSLSNSVMIDTMDDVTAKVIGFKKLHEDGEAGTSVGAIATGDAQAGSSDNPALANSFKLVRPAPVQVGSKTGVIIKNGKIIRKRVKRFAPKKFKAPAAYVLKRSEEIKNDNQ